MLSFRLWASWQWPAIGFLPNVQMLYNSLHLVATNRFSLDELADELDFSSSSVSCSDSEEGLALEKAPQ